MFGRVVAGMDVLDILNNVLTDGNDTPFAKAIIANCGELVLQIPKGNCTFFSCLQSVQEWRHF